MKGAELQLICRGCNVRQGGTKSDIYTRLDHHFSNIIAAAAADNDRVHLDRILPPSIMSFDLGYKNLAYVHMAKDEKILGWQRIDLGIVETFHPSHTAPLVHSFVREHIEPYIALEKDQKSDTVGAFVLERQRYRDNSAKTVLENTIIVNTIEALLWSSLLYTTRIKNAPYVIFDATARQAVDRVFKDDLDRLKPPIKNNKGTKNTTSRDYYRKKKATVLLATEWLDSQTAPAFKEQFHKDSKKDDLSDCLLQGIAWLKWRRFTRDFISDCVNRS